jgi:hypothetical protein
VSQRFGEILANLLIYQLKMSTKRGVVMAGKKERKELAGHKRFDKGSTGIEETAPKKNQQIRETEDLIF